MRLIEQRRRVRSFDDVIRSVRSEPEAAERSQPQGTPADSPASSQQPDFQEQNRNDQPSEPRTAEEGPPSQPSAEETPSGEAAASAESDAPRPNDD